MPKALWYVGPGMAELRDEPITPGPDDVRVRAHFGAISRGTEALVFAGRVPKSEYRRMRGPHMGGEFPYPVKYGYAVVGHARSRAAASRAGAWSSRFIRTRTSSRCRPMRSRRCLTACRRGARCSPPTWRRRSTPSGTAHPVRPTASPWSGPVSSVRSSRTCAGGCPAARSPWSTSLRRAPHWRTRWASASRRPKMLPRIATSCFMRAARGRSRHRARARRR